MAQSDFGCFGFSSTLMTRPALSSSGPPDEPGAKTMTLDDLANYKGEEDVATGKTIDTDTGKATEFRVQSDTTSWGKNENRLAGRRQRLRDCECEPRDLRRGDRGRFRR